MKRTSVKSEPRTLYDFRSFLQEKYRAASRRNAKFSLRSFARQLGTDHSTLSQILRSRRALSGRTVERFGKRLGLSDEVIAMYQSQIRKGDAGAAAGDNVKTLEFDLDTFQLLSAWHHQAILELTQLESFKADSRWIAKALEIDVKDVNIALQRLLRLKLLKMAAVDRWLDISGDAEFRTSGLNTTAINAINEELYKLALHANEKSKVDDRVNSAMVIAIDSKLLPQVKAMADEFMNQVRSLMKSSSTRDDVYQAAFTFFPLTSLKR